jgi:adenylate cyclase
MDTPPTVHEPTRLLIVDDEPEIRNSLTGLFQRLRRKPLIIDTAESGEVAVEKLAVQAYDLVISDYRMKALTGVDVLTRARELNPTGIRIIMTGYQELPIAVEAINRAEVAAFIQKPWDAFDLLSRVDQLLEDREQELRKERATSQALRVAARLKRVGKIPGGDAP